MKLGSKPKWATRSWSYWWLQYPSKSPSVSRRWCVNVGSWSWTHSRCDREWQALWVGLGSVWEPGSRWSQWSFGSWWSCCNSCAQFCPFPIAVCSLQAIIMNFWRCGNCTISLAFFWSSCCWLGSVGGRGREWHRWLVDGVTQFQFRSPASFSPLGGASMAS